MELGSLVEERHIGCPRLVFELTQQCMFVAERTLPREVGFALEAALDPHRMVLHLEEILSFGGVDPKQGRATTRFPYARQVRQLKITTEVTTNDRVDDFGRVEHRVEVGFLVRQRLCVEDHRVVSVTSVAREAWRTSQRETICLSSSVANDPGSTPIGHSESPSARTGDELSRESGFLRNGEVLELLLPPRDRSAEPRRRDPRFGSQASGESNSQFRKVARSSAAERAWARTYSLRSWRAISTTRLTR